MSDIKVGDITKDSDGNIGRVVNSEDPHNIEVDYFAGGKGLYCVVKDCHHYDEINVVRMEWNEELNVVRIE